MRLTHDPVRVYSAAHMPRAWSRKAYDRARREASVCFTGAAGAAAACDKQPGAAAWSPTTPGNLVAWFKANAGVTLSGSNVTNWADQSGNGYNLVGQTDPTFSSTAWNGTGPGLVFGGAAWMKSTDAGFASIVNGANANFTVLATVNVSSSSANNAFIGWNDGAGNTAYQYYLGFSAGGAAHHIFISDGGAHDQGGSVTVDAANKRVYLASGGGTFISRIDGFTDMVSVTFGVTPSPAASAVFLGLNAAGSFQPTMTLVELVVYSAKLTSTDFSNYKTYSTTTWGA